MSDPVRYRALPRGARGRRILATTVASLTAVATLSLTAAATAVVADSGTLDIQVPNESTSLMAPTSDGAQVTYVGDNDVNLGSSGTGVFEPFVRLQASGSEQGYNTDNGSLQFDETPGTWTHSMLVSDIPVVTVGGQRYWELWNDINESNSTPHIDLTDLEIYFASNPSITGYPFNTTAANTATPVYDFSGDIKMNDVNSGSGRGDLKYLVPLNNISIPSSCSYKNPACATQFVLYSKWGSSASAPGADTYATDGGFEEWKVKTYPSLTVTKTAATSYTRTYGWDITKTASPTALDLQNGQSGKTTWTVGVTKDQGTDSAWAVSGTITVANTGSLAATVDHVADTLSIDGSATVDCPTVTFPTVLAVGASFQCTYDKALPGAHDQTNTASAVLDTNVTFDGTAAVVFGAPTTLVYDSVDVTDTNGRSWRFAESGSVQYDQTFTCGADQGKHDNTATITQTQDSATASVTVTCHAPVVPLAIPAVTCATSATNVALPVAVSGQPDAKSLQDAVTVTGLASGATMTVTAVLYGPSATAGTRSNTVVATQTFQAGNGTTLTNPVSVSKPGYYTWEITTSQSTQVCGVPTLVHRADYSLAHVPTGFFGPVDSAGDRTAPTTITISKLGIKAMIATAPLNHGSIKIPTPNQVGWINKSASTSDLIGTTVVAGHVSDNHDRPGALFNLHKVRRGQIIVISGPDGVQKFKVTVVKTYSRSKALPKSLFSTTGSHRLVLVTCTDKVIHGGFFHYTKNLVVIAEPIA